MMQRLVWLTVGVALSGCLKTRAELRGENSSPNVQQQTVAQQRAQAREVREQKPATPPPPVPTSVRLDEIDEQMRALNGRVDVVENQFNQVNAGKQAEREAEARDKQAQQIKLQAYEDAIKKLEADLQDLSEEVNKLKLAAAAPPPATAAANAAGKTPWDEGEDLLKAKKWKEAIVAYQRYRDANPKGRRYADSTYKIGVAFQELGMKDEAKAFYDEVKEKFPGSTEAKKAQFRMKSLK